MGFFDNYRELCHRQGKTPNGVAKELGLPSASVTQWKHGSTPRPDTLKMIADYFRITVQELLYGDSKTPSTAGERIPTDEDMQAAFWGGYKDLTQDEISAMWEEVRAYAQFKAEEARRKKKK